MIVSKRYFEVEVDVKEVALGGAPDPASGSKETASVSKWYRARFAKNRSNSVAFVEN